MVNDTDFTTGLCVRTLHPTPSPTISPTNSTLLHFVRVIQNIEDKAECEALKGVLEHESKIYLGVRDVEVEMFTDCASSSERFTVTIIVPPADAQAVKNKIDSSEFASHLTDVLQKKAPKAEVIDTNGNEETNGGNDGNGQTNTGGKQEDANSGGMLMGLAGWVIAGSVILGVIIYCVFCADSQASKGSENVELQNKRSPECMTVSPGEQQKKTIGGSTLDAEDEL